MSGKLRAVPEENRAEWSALLGQKLLTLNASLRPGQALALFGGIKGEPDLRPCLRALWQMEVPVVLFAMEGTSLHPHLVRSDNDILSGKMGVWEPRIGQGTELPLDRLGVILVPALIFARADGARLGRGGGFYDRLLANPAITASRVGVGFSCQVVPTLPFEAHDIHMQTLVTEQGWWDIATQSHFDVLPPSLSLG